MTKEKAIEIIEEVLQHKAQRPIEDLHTIWCSLDIFDALSKVNIYKGLKTQTSPLLAKDKEYLFIASKGQMQLT